MQRFPSLQKTFSYINTIKFILLVFVLCIIKIELISLNEILMDASDNLPYVYFADKGFWNLNFLPYRPPIFSLWISLSNYLEFRFRIAQEIIFITSNCILVYTLTKLKINKFIIITIFILIMYSPVITNHLDKAMSDGFYTILQIYLFSFLTLSLLNLEKKYIKIYSFIAGLFFALTIHTRMEIEIAILILIMYIYIYFRLKKEIFFLIYFLIPVILISIIILFMNIMFYGYNGLTNILSKNESNIVKQLMRIDGGNDAPYVPITTNARLLAYSVSPTLKKYKPVIENEDIIKFSEIYTGIPGSLDTQRYLGLLREIDKSDICIFPEHKNLNNIDLIQNREMELEKISNELKFAIDNKLIPSRSVFVPELINPNIILWYQFIPKSIFNVIKLFYFSPEPIHDNISYGVPLQEVSRVNKILKRNLDLVKKGPIYGYFFTNKDIKIDSLSVYVNSNLLPVFKACNFPIIEINTLYLKSDDNGNTYFSFPMLSERWHPASLGMKIKLVDGNILTINNLHSGSPVQINRNGILSYEITSFELVESTKQKVYFKIQKFISDVNIYLFIVLSVFTLCILTAKRNQFITQLKNNLLIYYIFWLTFIFFFFRFILILLIEYGAWKADIRYLVPALPFFIINLMLIIDLCIISKKSYD